MADIRKLDFATAVNAVTVTDVQLSPDGRQVVYVTSRASIEKETPPVSTIWLIGADGGTPRHLTTGEGDSSPRWSPDGQRLAFVSDREQRGVGQLYLLDMQSGGEATRLTKHEAGVLMPEWAPDGKSIAYAAPDAPSEEEKKRQEEHDEKVIDEGVKGLGLWVLSVPDDPAALAPEALPEKNRLSPEGMHIGNLGGPAFSWAPDSAGVVTSTSLSPKADHAFVPELILIGLDGEVKRLGTFEAMGGAPRYSPDGSTIAFNAAEEVVPAMFSIQTIPATGGKSRILMPKFAGSFYGFNWLPEGDRLLAIVEEGQRHRLAIVDPEAGTAGDAIAPFEKPGVLGSWSGQPLSLSKDGKRVAFVRAEDTTFGDVYVAELGGEARKLTDLNPWTRDYDFGEVRQVEWASFDGMQIQGLLILPVGYQAGQRYPLLLQIHGGPSGAWGHHLYANWHDWGQFMAQRGYAVLMPNPRGSTGRGTEFLCSIVGCYGEPDWQDLITGVDHVIAEGIADPEQLVVGGWSGGGYLTNWTITHTERFKAAVSGAGIANWVSFQGTADVRGAFNRYFGGLVDEDAENHWKYSPIRSIKNAKTPTLILYGEQDDRVPPSQGHELLEGLKARGVEAKLVLYPREGHIINERLHQLDLLERVTAWFDAHLGRA